MDARVETRGKRKLQPANPTATLSLLLSRHRESEGVAFEVLVCLAGRLTPK